MTNNKQRINIVVIGHVDSGKSTTAGHLIYKCGGIDKATIDKFEQEATSLGRGSYKYAWVLDKMTAEREQGLTIDISLSTFQSNKYCFTIIDAPGHRDFIKNMITGTSRADAAMLVVPASTREFESGFSSDGQTREHALLAYTLGVKQIIVAINKMDMTDPPYDEERFNQVRSEIISYLRNVGYDADEIPVVPISGFNGDNMIEVSSNMPWWKGFELSPRENCCEHSPLSKGATLIDALDSIKPPVRPDFKPLRLPLLDVYKISGVGVVCVGRIESGILRPGMTLTYAPSGATSKVKSMELNRKSIDMAFPGDSISFSTSGISIKEVSKGSVAGDSQCHPPRAVSMFEAQIVVLNHPIEIKPGDTAVIDCHATQVVCKITELGAKVDKRTSKVIELKPVCLRAGESAIITVVPTKPMCVEPYGDYPQLGRFAMRDDRRTMAVGIVKSVQWKPQETPKRTLSFRLIRGKKQDNR